MVQVWYQMVKINTIMQFWSVLPEYYFVLCIYFIAFSIITWLQKYVTYFKTADNLCLNIFILLESFGLM